MTIAPPAFSLVNAEVLMLDLIGVLSHELGDGFLNEFDHVGSGVSSSSMVIVLIGLHGFWYGVMNKQAGAFSDLQCDAPLLLAFLAFFSAMA